MFKLTASGSQAQPGVQSRSLWQVVGLQVCCREGSSLAATTVIKVKNIATAKQRIGKRVRTGWSRVVKRLAEVPNVKQGDFIRSMTPIRLVS
jgi:hypothetical protein